ncbi:MAG: hypothetical protein A3K19_00870 [Lentisphaerae bacterium RIFOXYB12_FULL_65_16]|nr:MAG: hypothetical protein A3K18_20260 [Lentisphaerae bacterium RIFOXYA12_64_32]OGV84705.1 MAG: hypothetical protein A3K19_00870 [Lentisphaerae bacterium RIFOXYB12_FULL_65_16]
MRNTAFTILSSLAFLVALTWLSGCGGKAEDIDTTPFENAIQVYLKERSMELRVAEVKTIKVSGDTAEATISLEYAGEGVGAKVQWKFWFAKKDNAWVVTQHKQ